MDFKNNFGVHLVVRSGFDLVVNFWTVNLVVNLVVKSGLDLVVNLVVNFLAAFGGEFWGARGW